MTKITVAFKIVSTVIIKYTTNYKIYYYVKKINDYKSNFCIFIYIYLYLMTWWYLCVTKFCSHFVCWFKPQLVVCTVEPLHSTVSRPPSYPCVCWWSCYLDGTCYAVAVSCDSWKVSRLKNYEFLNLLFLIESPHTHHQSSDYVRWLIFNTYIS